MRHQLEDGRRKHFWWADNNLIDDCHIPNMGTSAFAIYAVILRHCDRNDRAFPSFQYLQDKTGLSRPAVSKAIKILIELKYIRKVGTGDSRRNSNTYEVCSLELVNLINQSTEITSSSGEPQLVNEVNQLTKLTSSLNEPQLVNEVNHQLVNEVNPKKTNTEENKWKKTHTPECGESEVDSSARSFPDNEPVQPPTIAAPPFVHPTVATEARMSRGAKLEVWEVEHGKPNPEFLEWIVKNDKSKSSALPLRVKARQTLYHARDKGSGLDAALWEQFQEEVIKPRNEAEQFKPTDFVFIQPEPEAPGNDREALIARLRGRIASKRTTDIQAAIVQAREFGIPLAELGLDEESRHAS